MRPEPSFIIQYEHLKWAYDERWTAINWIVYEVVCLPLIWDLLLSLSNFCYKNVLCRKGLRGVNTWWWQAEIGEVWPGAVPPSMLWKEGEGGWVGHLLVFPLSRQAPLVASVPALLQPWHWWTSLCVARSVPHSTNLALPHRRGHAMHHHKASSSCWERLEESH